MYTANPQNCFPLAVLRTITNIVRCFNLLIATLALEHFGHNTFLKMDFFNTYRNLCLEYLKILEQNRIRLQTVWRELKI